jgi:hypothetical protein
MNSASKRLLISSGAVLLLLLAVNLWLWPNQALQNSPTSFGLLRDGYKAAFDLLSEMKFPVTRSFRRPKLSPTPQTVWFVAPSFLEDDKPSAHDAAHEMIEWASRGGTAVIFGDGSANWEVLGLPREVEKGDEDRALVTGDLGTTPRWLDIPGLLHFTAVSVPSQAHDQKTATDSHQRVRLTANGKPFALEMKVGTHNGRIIAIADDQFLRNEHLAAADASVLVADLVRAFGPPAFDEHSHGLAPPASLTMAVLDSRVLLPIFIGLMVAMLWIFSQRTWPRRTLEDAGEMPAPSIASFVESLAILYSRANDPAAVWRTYREGFLRRLRRQLGLRADYPEELLLERIGRDRLLSGDTRRWLMETQSPADQRHLVIAVRAIESYSQLKTIGKSAA